MIPRMWAELEQDENDFRMWPWSPHRVWTWVLKREDSRMPFGFSVSQSGQERTKQKAEAAAKAAYDKWVKWYQREQVRVDFS